MDVNNFGEIIAKIESNNGKNALKKFRRAHGLSTEYTFRKRQNWAMFGPYGGAFYAAPERRKNA